MPKTRLTAGGRMALRELAFRVVEVPIEKAAKDDAYLAAAAAVRHALIGRFPLADMAILKKYDVARHDQCIRFQLTAGGVKQFQFNPTDEPYPLIPIRGHSYRMHQADAGLTTTLERWFTAEEAYKKAINTKVADYCALIDAARNWEDVIEVWPEADSVMAAQGRQLTIAVTPAVIDRIRADVATRQLETV